MARGVVLAHLPGGDPAPILHFGSYLGARFDAWLRNYDHRRAGSPWRFYAEREH